MTVTRRRLFRLAAGTTLAALQARYAPLVAANALRVGEAAPPATLVTLDGSRIATSDLLGKVVILTFWATWCGPCREELPLLSDYAAQYESRGLAVLGFTLDSVENLRQVRAVAETLKFPVGLLENASLPGYGRIWRIPVNFTIDRRGRLIDDGWRKKDSTWTAERLERVVTPMVRGDL